MSHTGTKHTGIKDNKSQALHQRMDSYREKWQDYNKNRKNTDTF